MGRVLLSIIIPTYNMASLLPRCLDSLMSIGEQRHLIEAIVVNDGSKDHSLHVAREWEERYPGSVVVIDKPNGNYGSTINAALPVARGKYVKVLDSDDWFDTAALASFIGELQTLETSDKEVDVVHTLFTQHLPKGEYEVVRYNTMGQEPFEYGKVYELDEVLSSGYIRQFLMHALTYRTEFLKKIGYRQTEGISYTDTEWASAPIYHAENIMFYDINLYQYNVDREGQTMDPKIIAKSLPQMERVLDSLISYYESAIDSVSDGRKSYLHNYITHRVRLLYKLYLLELPRELFKADELLRLDDKYFSFCNKHNISFKLFPDNKLLRIDYISYWNRHHDRWPEWLEQLNKLTDYVVKWVYVRLFRR